MRPNAIHCGGQKLNMRRNELRLDALIHVSKIIRQSMNV